MFTLFVSLSLAIAGAKPKPKSHWTPPGPHQMKMLEHLAARCKAGVGKACYEYGHTLEFFYGKYKHEQAMELVRHSCEMAYQKGCLEESPAQPVKLRREIASKAKSKRHK